MRVSAISITKNLNSQTFGRKIGGEDFPEKVVQEAERILKANEKVNKDNYKQDILSCWEDARIQPVEWLLLPYGKLLEKLGADNCGELSDVRKAIGVATLGVSELLKAPEAGIMKIISNVKAKKFASQVERCMLAMIREGKK